MPRPRVLLAVTVYNGASFVPRTVRSAANLTQSTADVDTLFLDDASPDTAFAAELEQLCSSLGLGYYRTPRNLGIVRNVNLGLLRAMDDDYDFVVVSNSDVVYPSTMIDRMVEVMASDPTVASTTAASNNVSIYSWPNSDPDRWLAEQRVVDDVNDDLWAEFGPTPWNIPAGISFAMMIRVSALRQIGLMDTVFGRGYCEETDWSLRSLKIGDRLTLSPGIFVYHAGRGSTVGAGLLQGNLSTVPENERIIDHRYPDFRRSVARYLRSGARETMWERATSRTVRGAAARHGYTVDLSSVDREISLTDDAVRVRMDVTSHRRSVHVAYRGFQVTKPLGDADPAEMLKRELGTWPDDVVLRASSPFHRSAAASFERQGIRVRVAASAVERV